MLFLNLTLVGISAEWRNSSVFAIMGKVIRLAGFVSLAAGCLMILATAVGVVMVDGFGSLVETLSLHTIWNFVALVPGIAMISLGWLIATHQGQDASRQ
jgi:hypothetical protein